MTDREKAIVMAYTGVCMLSGDKFKIFHEYVENIMGRPVYTHELADDAIAAEIKEKAKADFIELCAEQEPCGDLISRQYLLDNCIVDKVTMPYVPVNKIKNAPPVTSQPKTGHWIRMKAYEKWGCSECSTVFRFTFKEHDYCPNCGCRMVEPQESEDT